jgi:hypothetical protein
MTQYSKNTTEREHSHERSELNLHEQNQEAGYIWSLESNLVRMTPIVDIMAEPPLIEACGVHKPQIRTSGKGIPLLEKGAVNIFVNMPCPLKVPFKAEMARYLDEYNATHSRKLYVPTLLDGDSKGIEGELRSATSEDELPEILVASGFHTVLSSPFKERFIESGIYTGINPPAYLQKLPEEHRKAAQGYNLGFLAFGFWSIVCDMPLCEGIDLPKTWTDLVDPRFKNLLTVHGYNGKASITNILLVLQEKLGVGAISGMARNVKSMLHFAEVIKRLDTPDPERTPFNLLPNAASVQIPGKKRAAIIEFTDGPVLAPMLIFVKTSQLAELQEVLDFFWSDRFTKMLLKADFHRPDQMDWTASYSFPLWDFLLCNNFEDINAFLDAEFKKGLQK